jgi:tetratricopeptide (TPR) repeat protein
VRGLKSLGYHARAPVRLCPHVSHNRKDSSGPLSLDSNAVLDCAPLSTTSRISNAVRLPDSKSGVISQRSLLVARLLTLVFVPVCLQSSFAATSPNSSATLSAPCSTTPLKGLPPASEGATERTSVAYPRSRKASAAGTDGSAITEPLSAWRQHPQDGNYAQAVILGYIGLKQYGEARDALERYKSVCGATAVAYALEAELNFQQHHFQAAYRDALESLKVSDEGASVHEILGLTLAARGRYLDALPQLRIAAQDDPRNPQIQYFYGRILYSTGHYLEALREFRACLKSNPSEIRALLNLGLCYEALQQFTPAAQAYTTAIKLQSNEPSPKNVEPYVYLGALFAELHRSAEARAMLEKALGIDPRNFRAKYELGKLYLSGGDFRNAEKYLSNALVLDPNFAQTYYLIGRVYVKENRFGDAARYFAVFQQLNGTPANREYPFPK